MLGRHVQRWNGCYLCGFVEVGDASGRLVASGRLEMLPERGVSLLWVFVEVPGLSLSGCGISTF